MSVINQMLKELEQRQDDQSSGVSQSASTQISNKSPAKVTIAIIVIFIVLLNIIGLYIWNLYTENETLKHSATKPNIQTHKVLKTVLLPDNYKKTEEVEKKQKNKQLKKRELTVKNNLTQSTHVNNTVSLSKVEIVDENNEFQEIDKQVVYTKSKKPLAQNVATIDQDMAQYSQKELKRKNAVVTPLTEETIIDKTMKEVPKSSLSISRSKLSPERAVKKKLEKAERAIIDNEIIKAEKLFEDILLIQPEHKGARKQLSALWFGRKLFRPALNLLSKGIELYPNDVDFRLMKARILLNQNNKKEAFYVLNNYATVQHAEYQALLATTADSLGNISSVILAYKQLVNIEEHRGKWWLGLAVALDRNSQFEEAKAAYETALTKGNLSSNSAQFVRQRMIELGE